MTRHRTLGVVIPCLNDGALLRRCLAAFAAQTKPADEIIVVDNGSTDDSATIAAEFGARVVGEPRRGITWATRAGFDASTCDVMLRTDADVAPAPDFVAKLHASWDAADANSGPEHGQREVVGVTGSGRFELPGMRGRLSTALYLGAYRASVGSALGHQPFFGTNYSIRGSWWDDVRDGVDFSDVEVHEDMHLSFAVRPHETVWFQPDLVLDMDPRALVGARQVIRRFRRGAHTIRVNWRDQNPPRRLGARGLLPKALTR